MRADDAQCPETASRAAPAVKRVHLWVSGLVQGVYFRESTRQEADRWQVKGWVRNLHDGRVEALLEGPADAVDQLVAWCRRGPERAKVEHVDERDEPATGEFRSFQVRR